MKDDLIVLKNQNYMGSSNVMAVRGPFWEDARAFLS